MDLCIYMCVDSLVAQTVKKLPAMQETRVWSLVQEDPLIHIIFHILSHSGSSQDVEESSLCGTEEPSFSILSVSSRLLTRISQSSSPAHLPPGSHTSACVSVSLLLFCWKVHLCCILDFTYRWCHMILVFLFLTSLSWSSLGSCVLLQMAVCRFFIWVSCTPLYIYSTFSWWKDKRLYILLIGWHSSTWPNCWLTWFYMFQLVFFFFNVLSYIRVYLINNIMLILVIHILCQTLFPLDWESIVLSSSTGRSAGYPFSMQQPACHPKTP